MDEILGDGISDYFDCYPFTHQQAFEIKQILRRKFDEQSVRRFIVKLRFIVEGASCLLEQPDYKTYKNDRKSMLALIDNSSQLLDKIRQGNGIYRISNFSVLLDDELSERGFECQELAVTIGNLLNMLIRKLKTFDELNEKHIRGRPTADSKGIIREIVKIWELCFSTTPTKYVDGPFMEVVQIVLKGLNLPHEYPQRKINEALKDR